MIPDFEEWDGIRVLESAPLAPWSTFRLGGPCRAVIDCLRAGALPGALATIRATGEPWVLMGGGSNLLISDQGYDGYVIRFADGEPEWAQDGNDVTVSANCGLDRLARHTAERGLDGLVGCSGIPGSVGGAVVGNAGAWGQQVGDRLVEAEVAGPDGSVRQVPGAEMGFGYRCSRLQREPGVVLRARFRLEQADPARLLEERERILAERARKHPDWRVTPCIGSIFRNLEPSSAADRRQAAGWFLEQAGVHAMTEGGAGVFQRHANIIVAHPGCTAQNVRDLAARMADAVRQRFGLELVREVRFLGPFHGEVPAEGYY